VQFDVTGAPVQIAAEVKDNEFDGAKLVRDRKMLKLLSRSSQFAVAAAGMALRDAGLALDRIDLREIGVCMGSAPAAEPLNRHGRALIRCRDERGDVDLAKYWDAAQAELDPMDYLRRLPNMPSSNIAIAYNLLGPNNSIATACSAGTQAIGEATRTIAYADAKIMVAGGTDARITPEGLVRFHLLGALSTRNQYPQEASRPFDAGRDGFVLGEGAGVVVLEDLEFARMRGANIYAEVTGYGSSSDAYRLTDTHPEGRGAVHAMLAALRDASIAPEQVEYINAHGTSTVVNDRVETIAIKRVFGDAARKVAVSSTKSMTGHLISAAGAIEFICCVLAIRHNLAPPTINHNCRDESCDLDYVPNCARELKIDVAMSNSFGFGGQNAVVMVRRF